MLSFICLVVGLLSVGVIVLEDRFLLPRTGLGGGGGGGGGLRGNLRGHRGPLCWNTGALHAAVPSIAGGHAVSLLLAFLFLFASLADRSQ